MLAGKIGYFGSSFTPKSIANLAAWWDCSDSTKYTLVSGVVSSFTDSTGTYTITQSTAANRPSTTTINGLGAFSFNGSTSALFNTSAVAVPWGTYFAAITPDVSDNNARAIFGAGTNSPAINTVMFGVSSSSAGTPAVVSRTSSGTKNIKAASAFAANSTYVLTGTADSSQNYSIRLNGAAGTTTGTGGNTGNYTHMSVGCYITNANPLGQWSGKIGEVLWYSRVLNSTEIGQVETYLKGRWGVSF